MILIRITSSPLTRNLCTMSKRSHEAIFPVMWDTSKGRSNTGCVVKDTGLENQFKRVLHTTKIHHDLETGLKAVGAGLATLGATGPGIGIGLVFGNFLLGATRNPSAAQKLLGQAIVGAAFCESIALFCLMVSFVLII